MANQRESPVVPKDNEYFPRPAYRSPRVVAATHLGTMIPFSHWMDPTQEEKPAESLTCVGSTELPKREEDRCRLLPTKQNIQASGTANFNRSSQSLRHRVNRYRTVRG